jgi:ABC-type Mn2+/Zn2+ transport system ATPase subunit
MGAPLGVEISQLSYEYGARSIGPVSLNANASEKVTLTGFGGSGKSTICRVLAGRLPSFVTTMGDVKLPPYYSGSLQHTLFVVPRNFYIGTNPQAQLLAFKVADLFSAGPKAVESVGLSEAYLDRETVTLSTGEATRVLLAVSFERAAELLILDDPWGFIDPESRLSVAETTYEHYAHAAVVETDTVFAPLSHERRIRVPSTTYADAAFAALSQVVSQCMDRKSSTSVERVLCVSGYSRAQSRGSHFRLDVEDLRLVAGQLTWIIGDNGTGKSTFGRDLAEMPSNKLAHSARYQKLWLGAVPAETTCGYVSGRFPFDDRRMVKQAISLLGVRLDSTAAPPLGYNEVNEWRGLSSIMSLLGAALDQLMIGRRVVIIDEPWTGCVEDEVAAATIVLRRWAQDFGAVIMIIAHLDRLPNCGGEGVVSFVKEPVSNHALAFVHETSTVTPHAIR